eukprot:gb/GECG01003812.1/.p1 GENE.gb/GECG01003812.1/~~gb/GECG01003812.1/.p1  ORF type:complete len:131 (+),score=9.91 gb/GECG01003812.1/:1-393(+)
MQGHPPPPPPPTSANTGADTGEVDASLPRVEDILTIDPTDRLLFESRLPDDDGTQWEATLMLRNTSGFHIAFKVKTTAPAKYIVRPNKGIIDPETTAHVRCKCKENLKCLKSANKSCAEMVCRSFSCVPS